MDLPFQGKTYRFPQRFFLTHALAHSCEHRAEMKAALAHIGVETPDMDGWWYATAVGYDREVA